MSRVHAFLAIIDDPTRAPMVAEEQDEPLLRLMVHLAMSDGVLEDDEIALLARMRAGDEHTIRRWVQQMEEIPFEYSDLQQHYPEPAVRNDILRLAARMVCLDGDLAFEEQADLAMLARALGVGVTAVPLVIDEVIARGGPVKRSDLLASLRNMFWNDLIPERGDLESSLAQQVQGREDQICRILLDDTEVAALFEGGLLARFDDENRFVPWKEIDQYTRVPVSGAAFHLTLADGKRLSMKDPRLGDLGALLDFIYGRTPIPRQELP